MVSPAGAAQADTGSQNYSGTLVDGATWVADVPANWNGTMILFSHGYSSMVAQDAPNAATRQDLLAAGYAMVGSSYSGPSLWALSSAVDDQFGALEAVGRTVGEPRRTIAWGQSMGGLVSALETQKAHGRIDGTLTTCGLVAGALNLNDYQLDGEYAVSRLLSPQPIKLVDYKNADEASAAVAALNQATTDAQKTPQGRARIALAAALVNEPTWYTGTAAPGPHDYEAQEAQQQQALVGPGWSRYAGARPQIELAAGGNSSATAGVDFAAALKSSTHADEVRALYRAAGLDLRADLATLTRDADIHADPKAVATLARTSMVTGRLGVPELNIHTIHDQLVPVEQENWYGRQVRRAGSGSLLRQAYINGTGHCAFQPAETIAALHAVEHRLDTGRWDDVTTPDKLNSAAASLHLADSTTARYAPFTAPPLVGGLGEPGREHSL
ncbi:alpha/beta hydrolase [Streptomyces fuscichromogenes]|uniref:alpha/beta hydrolase n=1 Tax=Streptomyces fuscichromogenes TaxID=1324013 RepID=UPI00382A3CB7